MESEEEEDQKPDTATTLKNLQVAEVSLICTGWRRAEDYGEPREPRRFINMNCPLDDDDDSCYFTSTICIGKLNLIRICWLQSAQKGPKTSIKL